MTRVAAAVCAALAVVGCQYPRDPDGTLDRVRGGTLRVGVTQAEPFVTLDGGARGGVEVRLLEQLARDLDARIDWVEGGESELIAALKEGQLDVVVGGLTTDAPWTREAALTRPYLTTRTVVGVPPRQAVPDDLEGVRVAVERGSEDAGLLAQKTDATPVRVDDIAAARGSPAAVGDWLLDDLGLRDAGIELREEKHAMAVRLGENAWLVRLERFLLDRRDEIRALLEREGRP